MTALRMLYVEDDRRDYETYARALVRRGWMVERACNPPEALRKLRKASPSYDVILIDRSLEKEDANPELWEKEWGDPTKAGDPLVERVVAESAYICPIMLTVTNDAKVARNATKHGAQFYLVKGDCEGENCEFGDFLDEHCRQGVVRQRLYRLRHTLLRTPTFDILLKEIFLFLRDTFEEEDGGGLQLNLFYLDLVPGRGLQVHAAEGNDRPLASAWLGGAAAGRLLPLIAPSGNLMQVLQRSRLLLAKNSRELLGQTLTDTAMQQLLVPVLVGGRPDETAHRLAGVLAVESDRSFLAEGDFELFENVTALLADYLANRSWWRRAADQEREEERKKLLDGIACRLCGPLQQAQSTLELLNIHQQRGQALEADQVRERVAAALEAVERATLAAENLREFQPAFALKLQPVNLTGLVCRTLRQCQSNLQAAGVTVDAHSLEQHSEVVCLADADHLAYVVEGLLRNCWETALRFPAGQPGAGDRTWRATLQLDVDPSEQLTARLTLRDNGPGFTEEVLRRFAEGLAVPSQKRFTGMARNGLGLVEARRILELSDSTGSSGRLEIRNAPEGGAVVCLFLPLHDPEPETISDSVSAK